MSCVSENTYIVQKGGDVPFLEERLFREDHKGQKGGKSKKPKSKKPKSKKNKSKKKKKSYWK